MFALLARSDDDGGIPGAHVAQIMGSCQNDASRALAAGVLAYSNEPTTGTLCQVGTVKTEQLYISVVYNRENSKAQ